MKTIIFTFFLQILLGFNLYSQIDTISNDSISNENLELFDLFLGKLSDSLKIELSNKGQIVDSKKVGSWKEHYYKPCLSCDIYAFNYDSVLYYNNLYNDLTFYMDSGIYDNGQKTGKWIKYKSFRRSSPFYWEKYITVDYVNGMKVGWEYKYYGDTLTDKTFYKNGLKDSIEYFYDSGDILYRTTSYKNGIENGFCHDYYKNGNIEIERDFLNGKQVGTLKYFSSNGILQFEVIYNNGEPGDSKIYVDSLDIGDKGMALLFFPPHNKHISYYKNGNIKKVTEFIDGVNHIRNKDFYPNGNVSQEFELINDTIDGTYRYFYENGNLWTERFYIKGKLWEVTKNLTIDGKKSDKGTLKNGTGTLKSYDLAGKLLDTFYYNDGEEIKNDKK